MAHTYTNIQVQNIKSHLGYFLHCTVGRVFQSVLDPGSNSCVKRSDERGEENHKVHLNGVVQMLNLLRFLYDILKNFLKTCKYLLISHMLSFALLP